MLVWEPLIEDAKHGGQAMILINREEVNGSIVDTEIKTEDDKRVIIVAVVKE